MASMGNLVIRGLIGLSIALGLSNFARANDAADFFNRKTITLMVGYSVGGSYDAYGRLAAEFLSHYLPGKPTVIVKNMVGGGSFKAANYMATQAPTDGSMIGLVGPSLVLSQAFHYPGVSFDMSKMQWLGRLAPQQECMILSDRTKVKTIEEAKHTQVVLAGNAVQANGVAFPRLLNRILHTKFKIISGYPGSAGMLIAMERGEVEGFHSDLTFVEQRRKQYDEGKLVVPVVYANVAAKSFPKVPTLASLAANDADRRLFKIFGTPAEIGRALMAPPGVPTERVEAYRSAFAKMVVDPKFIEAAHKRSAMIDPMDGASVQRIVTDLLNLPSDEISRAATAWAVP